MFISSSAAKKVTPLGPVRESNPGPLAPKARIMPLDQQAGDMLRSLLLTFYLNFSITPAWSRTGTKTVD